MKLNNKKPFFTSTQFLVGILVGMIIITFIAYFPTIITVIDLNLNPITINDCNYGLHDDFWFTRCINHNEMQEILGCENFYLRSGYWWECIDNSFSYEIENQFDPYAGHTDAIMRNCYYENSELIDCGEWHDEQEFTRCRYGDNDWKEKTLQQELDHFCSGMNVAWYL